MDKCIFVLEDFPSVDGTGYIVNRYRVCPVCKHRDLISHEEKPK
jgi:hypothetical protein